VWQCRLRSVTLQKGRAPLSRTTQLSLLYGPAERRKSTSVLLRRHAVQTAILREVGRRSFFLVGYFLKMLATLLSAMERRISPERRAVIDHDATLCAVSHNGDVHASDKRSVIVRPVRCGMRTALLSVRKTRSTISGSVMEIFPNGRSL
jgi:hypothetical protein